MATGTPSRTRLMRTPSFTHPAIVSAAATVAAALIATTAPRSLQAQTRVSLDAFAARSDALPGRPTFGGIALAVGGQLLGLRGSFAFDPVANLRDRESNPDCCGTVERYRREGLLGAWAADADLTLSPYGGRSAVLPYGLVGIGIHGNRAERYGDEALDTRFPVWSVGGGVQAQIAGPLFVMGEARYRTPVDRDLVLPAGYQQNWEYRVGISLSNARTRSRGGWGDHGRRNDRRASVPSRPSVVVAPRAPRTSMPSGGSSRGNASTGSRVISTGDDYLGTRYVYGGTSPTSGFDCSGFVQFVYGRHGIDLPRTSRQMAQVGERFAPVASRLRAGDLVFFATRGDVIDHVAMYAGDNRILHSSSSGSGVRYDNLDTERGRWFMRHAVAARRVTGTSGAQLDVSRLVAPEDGQLDPPDKAPRP